VNIKIEGNTCDLISYTVSQFLGKTEEGHEELVEWSICGFHPESLPIRPQCSSCRSINCISLMQEDTNPRRLVARAFNFVRWPRNVCG
jgi:hypothetical protein